MRKIITAFTFLFMVNLSFAQFESANITAYFTDELAPEGLDSTITDPGMSDSTVLRRKVEIKIENLDSLAVHGCIVEVLEDSSNYILSRKIGNKYDAGSMGFVRFENNAYYINAGYFREDMQLKVLVRLEDYNKVLSDLVTLTIAPYEE